MKRVTMFITLLLVFSLMLNVCGESSAEKRDTINISVNMIATNIDPHNRASLVHDQIKTHVYESFYQLNEWTGEYEPRVAASHTVSGDGLTYTFKLRPGVKFHNGETLKASDAVFSINRAIKDASVAQFVAPIEKAEADGDDTVIVTLKYPFAPFMHHMRMIYIISEKAVQEIGEGNMASMPANAGTGPYYMTSYRPDIAIEYEAFADYYRGEAAIKKIVSRPFPDVNTGLIAFENGELDFYTVPLANWAEIESSGKYNTRMVPQNHISVVRMNPNRSPLNDIRVREAITLCVDRQALNVLSYEGYAVDAPKILYPGYVFGAPPLDYGTVHEPNIEKAKKLLAEAGYPNGVNIGELRCIAGMYYEKTTTALQASLARAGITARVAPLEQSSCVTANINGDFGVTVYGYGNQFDYSYMSFLIDFTVGELYTPLFDDVRPLLEQGASENDPEIRKELYKQADELIMNKFYMIPIFYRTSAFAWDKNLNLVPPALYYNVYDWSWN